MNTKNWNPLDASAKGVLILAFLNATTALTAAQENPKADGHNPVESSNSLFPDQHLEKAVRAMVYAKRDNSEPLNPEDVAKISTIKGAGLGIKSLAGLEHCTMLASLELPKNEISDLSPLKDLSFLQLLDLSDNQIEDLSPLAGLKRLQYLNIEKNQVTSASPLRNLEILSSLYASGNRITEIEPILKLSKLWSLHLNDNRIADLTGISQLDRVDTFGFSGNQIRDLSPLAGTAPRHALYLAHNEIADLTPLLTMCKKDLEGERRFASYVRIYLEGNPLSPEGSTQLEEMKKLGLKIVSPLDTQ